MNSQTKPTTYGETATSNCTTTFSVIIMYACHSTCTCVCACACILFVYVSALVWMVFVVLSSISIVERPWMGLVALVQPLLKKGVSKYRPTKDILVYNFYDFVGGTTVCPSVNILIVYNMENIHQLCIKLHCLTACIAVCMCVPLAAPPTP